MKRVVIEDIDKDTIPLSQCGWQSFYIAKNKETGKWAQLVYINSNEYVVHKMQEANFDLAKFNSIDHAIRSCAHIYTFYQFPDFRSAMEYYLEQSKTT